MHRAVLLALLLALTVGLAGCGLGGVRSGEETAALPETVVGTVEQAPVATAGDPAKGKAVYAANGCGGCHTYGPAGSNGAVGPKLDNLDAASVAQSITSPGSVVVAGFPDGVMPTYSQLTSEQVGDLVAFLTKPGG